MASGATVEVVSSSELVRLALEAVRSRSNPMLLFEETAMPFHDEFCSGLPTCLENEDQLIWLRGEQMDDAAAFYRTVREAVPHASYMGSNLDALSDVLRGEAVFPFHAGVKYWLWTRADVLFQRDPTFFWRAYGVVTHDARENSEGTRNPRTGERYGGRQRVALVITGTWETMGAEARRHDSAFFLLPMGDAEWFGDRTTRVKAFRIASSS